MNPTTIEIEVNTVTLQKPAPVSDRPKIKKMYIDGQWKTASSGRTFEVYNPITNELLETVVSGGTLETKEAIDAAYLASQRWAVTLAKQRGRILQKAQQIVEAQREDLARLIASESGKSHPHAQKEVNYALGYFTWFANKVLNSQDSPIVNRKLWMQSQPRGVVAIITPWNFPLAEIARKLLPALAAGCTVVLKPSEQAPLTALAIAQIFHNAGIPFGVLNVVTGLNAFPICGEIINNPKVAKMYFTSSTEAAKPLRSGYLLAMWDYLTRVSQTVFGQPQASIDSLQDSGLTPQDCKETIEDYMKSQPAALKIS